MVDHVDAQRDRITGRDWCDFISWTPEGINVIRIKRNPEHFDFLLEHYKKLFTQVQNRRQPCNMSKADKDAMNERLMEMYEADKIEVPRPPSPEPAPEFDNCPCANSDDMVNGTTGLPEGPQSIEPAFKKRRLESTGDAPAEC